MSAIGGGFTSATGYPLFNILLVCMRVFRTYYLTVMNCTHVILNDFKL